MSARSFSLRMLIALGVILNGSPLAMAYAPTSMHAAAAVLVIENDTSVDTMAEMPCHDMAAGAPSSAMINPHKSSEQKAATLSAKCCDSGACSCACAHGFAAVPTVAFFAASVTPDSIDAAAEGLHASPVLPHQSRPPIA